MAFWRSIGSGSSGSRSNEQSFVHDYHEIIAGAALDDQVLIYGLLQESEDVRISIFSVLKLDYFFILTLFAAVRS